MSTFSFNEVDNYGVSNSGSFFTLPDDGDSAKVRLLYNTIEDVKGHVVHEVQVGDKKRYVACLRSYNEPVEKCPLCAAQYKQVPKLFISLYNMDTDEPQIWERGKTYFSRLAGLASHYNPLCGAEIEIQRHGKKGDKKTTYEFYPLGTSDFNLDDVEIPNPLGTIILDKTAADMQEYLQTGEFPDDGSEPKQPSNEYQRRTPASNRRAF